MISDDSLLFPHNLFFFPSCKITIFHCLSKFVLQLWKTFKYYFVYFYLLYLPRSQIHESKLTYANLFKWFLLFDILRVLVFSANIVQHGLFSSNILIIEHCPARNLQYKATSDMVSVSFQWTSQIFFFLHLSHLFTFLKLRNP